MIQTGMIPRGYQSIAEFVKMAIDVKDDVIPLIKRIPNSKSGSTSGRSFVSF